MSTTEAQIIKLETEFPALSGSAFLEARKEAFAAGLSVLEAVDGIIYEVFPDGSRQEKKRIAKPTPVIPGTKLFLR